MLFDRLASRVFGTDTSCISPGDLARNVARSAEPLGPRHFGRSAHRARPHHRRRLAAARAPVLTAQEYWRVKGLRADVVILNEHPADYLDEMQNHLSHLVQEPPWAGWIDKPGGMFLLRADGMPEADRHLLAAVAASSFAGPRRSRAAAGSSRAVAVRGRRRAAAPRSSSRRAGRGPGAGAAARHGERPRRFHAGRPRIRDRARRRSRDAAALVERAGESRVRHDRQQFRFGIHLGGKQPREPADAVRQRSARRSDGGSVLPARRRLGRRVGRHAGPAAPAPGWRPVGGASRRGRHAYQHAVAGLDAGAGRVRRARRSREARRSDADQHAAMPGGA